MTSTRGKAILFLLVSLTLAIGAVPSNAQSGVGLRAGISIDPEQFYFGAHADVAEVVSRFWFRPNIEVGVGDSRTVIALNGEFAYFLPLRQRDWNVYFGGGPAAVIRTFRGGPGDRDTDAGPGFNMLVGLARRRGLMTEIKVGALDSPSFKLGIGWTW